MKDETEAKEAEKALEKKKAAEKAEADAKSRPLNGMPPHAQQFAGDPHGDARARDEFAAFFARAGTFALVAFAVSRGGAEGGDLVADLLIVGAVISSSWCYVEGGVAMFTSDYNLVVWDGQNPPTDKIGRAHV